MLISFLLLCQKPFFPSFLPFPASHSSIFPPHSCVLCYITVRLGQMLAYTQLDEKSITLLNFHLQDFLRCVASLFIICVCVCVREREREAASYILVLSIDACFWGLCVGDPCKVRTVVFPSWSVAVYVCESFVFLLKGERAMLVCMYVWEIVNIVSVSINNVFVCQVHGEEPWDLLQHPGLWCGPTRVPPQGYQLAGRLCTRYGLSCPSIGSQCWKKHTQVFRKSLDALEYSVFQSDPSMADNWHYNLGEEEGQFYCTQGVHCVVAGEERGSVWQPSGDQEQHSTTRTT